MRRAGSVSDRSNPATHSDRSRSRLAWSNMLGRPAEIGYNALVADVHGTSRLPALAESFVLGLFFTLVLMGISLIAVLWVGAYLFQGYIYTEPSPGLFWQAPAAGIVLTIGYAIWCFTVALGQATSPTNIPINTIIRFTPWEDMLERPAPRIWAIKLDRLKKGEFKDGDKVLYLSARDRNGLFIYKDSTIKASPWQSQDVIAIELERTDNPPLRFDLQKSSEGGYRRFISPDGWVIVEYDHPTGLPIRFSYGRLFWNVAFNVFHFVGWFLVLWVLLRFQWSHALGLAVVAWLIFTIIILPMLLFSAAEVAVSRRTAMEFVIRLLV